VGNLTVARQHDLGVCVSAWSRGFYFYCYEGKEQDLPCPHGAVPHWTGDAIAISECRGGKEGCGPGPGGDDFSGNETRLHGAGCRVKFFCLVGRVACVAVLQISYC
jgi:hypothetical protein